MGRWLGNLVVMGLTLGVGLGLLEFGVRRAGFRAPSSRADRLLGHRYRPNTDYFHLGEEGRSHGRYNAGGWRDVDHAEAKPPGTTRILVLGDSYVSAFQVPLDSTFHRRLERTLNLRAIEPYRFEVIAMGQDGNGTTSELLTYETLGRRYDPDIVAVLFVQNDPADNWKPFALEKQRPFLVEDGDSLRLDVSFHDDPGFQKWARPNWLRDHSALWSAARVLLERARTRKATPQVIGGEAQDGYYRSWNFDRRVNPDTLTPFRITEKILARFAREVRSDGRRFVVFHVGFGQQEDPASLDSLRKDPNFDENKSARWLMAAGARDGYPVIPMSPGFRQTIRERGRPLWFGHTGVYGHWNNSGHGVACRIMTRFFARTVPGLDASGTAPSDVPGLVELEASSRLTTATP
jgi:hypothetical protein